MTYTGAMVLPQNAVRMNTNEMRYVEGGKWSGQVPMKRAYLNKVECNSIAGKHANWNGYSKSRIAHEIYAHAVAYYAAGVASVAYSISPWIPGFGKTLINLACAEIRRHAAVVNIGGDRDLVVKIYDAIWKYL